MFWYLFFAWAIGVACVSIGINNTGCKNKKGIVIFSLLWPISILAIVYGELKFIAMKKLRKFQ